MKDIKFYNPFQRIHFYSNYNVTLYSPVKKTVPETLFVT